MENNKYYDLIKNLIKENKKFPGHEEILDAIADDVYEHAKVVLNSVTNEDVLAAYLEKVVTTSIITVSKKLNNNVRPRASKAVDAILEARRAASEARQAARAAADFKPANTTLVDKMINSTATELLQPEQETESPVLNIELQEEISSPVEEVSVSENLLEQSDNTQESIEIEDSASIFEQETETPLTLEPSDVEDALPVEATETELSVYNEPEPIEEEEEEEELNLSITSASDEPVEEIQEPDETAPIEEDEFSLTDAAEEEPEILIENTTEETPSENIDILTEEAGEVSDLPLYETEESVPQEDFSLENSADSFVDTPLEEFAPMQTGDVLDFIETVDENETELSTDTGSLDEIPDEIQQDISDEPASPTINTNRSCPDYSVFEYTPDLEDTTWSEADVKEELDNINKKEPDVQVYKIYELRYNKGYTVDNISKELDIDKEKVLDTLVEISLLVKE